MASETIYIATAYRYGWSNGETVLVYAGTDLEKAVAMSLAEASTSGGKYGVAVSEFGTGEIKHYSPSAYGEKKPTFNEAIYVASRIGSDALEACRKVKRGRECPRWLKRSYEFNKTVAEGLAETFNGKKADHAP